MAHVTLLRSSLIREVDVNRKADGGYELDLLLIDGEQISGYVDELPAWLNEDHAEQPEIRRTA